MLVHPELKDINSVVLLKRQPDGVEEVFTRSSAIRECIAGLPKFRLFQLVLNILPRLIADLGYDFFAKYRGTLVGPWHNLRPPTEDKKELYVE